MAAGGLARTRSPGRGESASGARPSVTIRVDSDAEFCECDATRPPRAQGKGGIRKVVSEEEFEIGKAMEYVDENEEDLKGGR